MTLACVYVDFDGTVSREDSTDALLTRFADPGWLEIEAAWLRSEIGSRACLSQQVALLRLSPQTLDDFAAEVELDPAFADFAAFCQQAGVPVRVLSDGLDRVVTGALRRAGIMLPVIANRLVPLGEDRWSLEFPHARPDCRAQAGNCKCASLTAGNAEAILVGDGRSDFCGAGVAGTVLAKDRLLRHCRETGIAHHPFGDFAEARLVLQHLLAAPPPLSLPVAAAAHGSPPEA